MITVWWALILKPRYQSAPTINTADAQSFLSNEQSVIATGCATLGSPQVLTLPDLGIKGGVYNEQGRSSSRRRIPVDYMLQFIWLGDNSLVNGTVKGHIQYFYTR